MEVVDLVIFHGRISPARPKGWPTFDPTLGKFSKLAGLIP